MNPSDQRPDSSPQTVTNDDHFNSVLADYLGRLDAGEKVDQDALIKQYPDLAESFREFFRGSEQVEKMAGGILATQRFDPSSTDQIDQSAVTQSIAERETVPPRPDAVPNQGVRKPEQGAPLGNFGRYRLKKVLGQGAMGTVYLAEDTQLDRQVALKIPKFFEAQTPEMIARFYREAKAAATILNPNICPVYDVGEIDRTHYISMAYITGRQLSDFIQGDSLPTSRQVMTVLRKVALALDEAHRQGIIHRDLKPDNIMIDQRGDPVIMDFGLARRLNKDDARLTQSGDIVGSPAYMSPEQLTGNPDDVVPASDIYSLGVILYELLTGQIPFRGGIAAVISQILSDQPKRPSLVRPGVDPGLESICLKMMAKKTCDRFATMRDVAEAINQLIKSPGKELTPPTNPTSSKPVSSKPAAVEPSKRVPDPASTKQQSSVKTPQITDSSVAALLATAKDLCKQHSFDEAIQLLKAITDKRHTPESRELLEKVLALTQEIAELKVAIEYPVLVGEEAAFEKKLKRLLELQPQNRNARKLWVQCRPASKRDFPKPTDGLSAITSSSGSGFSWISQPFLIAGGLAASLLMFAVVIYFQSGKTTVKLVIEDPLLTVKFAGDTFTIDSEDKSITVKPERQTLTVSYGGSDDLKVETKSFEVKRGLKNLIKVSVVNGEVVLTPIDAVTTGGGGGSQAASVDKSRLQGTPTVAPPPAIAPFDYAQAKRHQEEWAAYLKMPVEYTNSIGMKFRLIPPGEFLMGSPESDASARASEKPQHKVKISHPFYLSRTEVTQAQWTAVMNTKPWQGKARIQSGADYSAMYVSWDDTMEFCRRLEMHEGRNYQIPTEAEWEYACRAGTATKWSFGDDVSQLPEFAWFTQNGRGRGQDYGQLVALMKPNPFGLYDMHGNLWEWCRDGYREDAYQSRQEMVTDPWVAMPAKSRAIRGGSWNNSPEDLRAAIRNSFPSSQTIDSVGIRLAMVADSMNTMSTQKLLVSAPKKPLAFQTPGFDQWVKETTALPAEKQLEAVSKKLIELNPGFDGTLMGSNWQKKPTIKDGVVTEVWIGSDDVTDLSPVRALGGLKVLACNGSSLRKSRLSDLTPLKGLALTNLHFNSKNVTDLSPLHGMPLKALYCVYTSVVDLSPLNGMPLETLWLEHTKVSDVSSLEGMNLKSINLTPRNITGGMDVIRRMKSVQTIGTSGLAGQHFSSEEFWKKYDAGEFGLSTKLITDFNSPAFQQWIKDVQAMPAEKQVEAVAKKLQELNPRFDGKLTGSNGQTKPKIRNGVVTEVWLRSDDVTDLSPVRALVGLKVLACSGSSPSKSRLSDLTPLKGLALTTLYCKCKGVADLSPLQGMPLKALYCEYSSVVDLSPLKGMPLETLLLDRTKVSDLSTLEGMSLKRINLTPRNITRGMDVIRRMKSVQTIGTSGLADRQFPSEEFWKKYDAGEFGIPTAVTPITDFKTPAFQQWSKDVQAMPAEKQLEAVSKKLIELNPGFDGKITDIGWDGNSKPKIENGVVTQLGFFTNKVTDVSPVRALSGLKALEMRGSGHQSFGRLSDLSPLEGMFMTALMISFNPVSDLSPLTGMPLTTLHISETHVDDLSPLQGMPLKELVIYGSPVSDLSPLQGMNMTRISFTPKEVNKGMDVLRTMNSLQKIGSSYEEKDVFSAAEFWKKYDAGEFGKATP